MTTRNVGGSALIEGVMMSADGRTAAAARLLDGTIFTEVLREAPEPTRASRIRALPFLRGVLGVGAGLGLSVEALRWSAKLAATSPKDQEVIDSMTFRRALFTTMAVFGVIFGVAPALIALRVLHSLDLGALLGVVEGSVRLAMFAGYVAVVALIPNVRRVFAYHGAEHKSINAFEAGAALTPQEVSRFSRLHPRCGTSFVVLVLILTSLAIPVVNALPLAVSIPARFLVVFVAASVAYELQRLASRHITSWWARVITAPGLLLQRLTTKEPDLAQVEVAIAALKASLDTPANALAA